MATREGPHYHTLIRELPSGERPRERLRDAGAAALSTAELLAIILRVGVPGESVLALAQRLLKQYNGLTGLAQATFGELCNEHGLGEAKAAQLKAALELGRRLAAAGPEERVLIRSPQDVANLVMSEMSLLDREELWTLLLNTKNQVVTTVRVYRGNVNTSTIRVGEVFRDAVRQTCPALIVLHNHPSGDPTPSADDIAVTKQIVEAGRLLDIDVLDHIVIGQGRFVSLKERRLGFS